MMNFLQEILRRVYNWYVSHYNRWVDVYNQEVDIWNADEHTVEPGDALIPIRLRNQQIENYNQRIQKRNQQIMHEDHTRKGADV